MKKLGKLMALAMLCTGAVASNKVGVVDLDSILHQSKQVQTMNAALEKKFAPEHDALMKQQKALSERIHSFRRNAEVMDKAKRDKQSEALHQEESALSKKQMAFSKKVVAEQRAKSLKLLEKLREVVSNIAKKEDFDMIIAKQSVLYTDKSHEITEKVRKHFD